MKLTTQELEQMRSVDIGAVAAESLPDVSGMTFDNALSRKERISRFLQTVKNPYCFCIGGVGVKIECKINKYRAGSRKELYHGTTILRRSISGAQLWTGRTKELRTPP